MKKRSVLTRKQLAAFVVLCFLIGLGLSITIRVHLTAAQTGTSSQNKNLIDVINNLEAETEGLESKISEMREQIATTQQEYGTDADTVIQLQKDLDSLKFLAGQTAASGPGITLTISDNVSGAEAAKAVDPENFYAENYIVHDTDLRYLLNDVAYLADGIAINNQRIVSTSDIRCVGTVIMVNSTRLAPPYEIKLIGSSTLLEAAIQSSDQYVYLNTKGMPMKMMQQEELILPPYTGSMPSTYIQVDYEKMNNEQEN